MPDYIGPPNCKGLPSMQSTLILRQHAYDEASYGCGTGIILDSSPAQCSARCMVCSACRALDPIGITIVIVTRVDMVARRCVTLLPVGGIGPIHSRYPNLPGSRRSS